MEEEQMDAHLARERKHSIRIQSHPSGPLYYEGEREDIWNYFRDGKDESYRPPTLFKADAETLDMYGLDLNPEKTYFVSALHQM